jgi:hypothetical protein
LRFVHAVDNSFNAIGHIPCRHRHLTFPIGHEVIGVFVNDGSRYRHCLTDNRNNLRATLLVIAHILIDNRRHGEKVVGADS